MANVPKKTANRIIASVPKFQKVLKIAKDRDLNESDTVSIITDIFAEVFGYDKYLEITSEFMIRGTYCDLAIKISDKVHLLVEAKAIGIDLKENHLKQAIDYGANHGIQWVLLTNGIDWQLYRIRFEKPINYDLVARFDFLELNAKKNKDQELLYILTREGVLKESLDKHFELVKNVNRYVIGNLILDEAVINVIRRELRKLSNNVKIDSEEIETIIKNEVIKREVLEGEDALRAKKKVRRKTRKNTTAKNVRSISDDQAIEDSQSVTDRLLSEQS